MIDNFYNKEKSEMISLLCLLQYAKNNLIDLWLKFGILNPLHIKYF